MSYYFDKNNKIMALCQVSLRGALPPHPPAKQPRPQGR